MILVDTSVWIDYYRGARPVRSLRDLLDAAEVVTHPFVLGELALGHLGRHRAQILKDLAILPLLSVVPDEEVLQMVEAHRLAGTGIGWVDAHLLAAALLPAGTQIWTVDGPLSRIASRLGVGR